MDKVESYPEFAKPFPAPDLSTPLTRCVEASKCAPPMHYRRMAFTLRQLQYFIAVAEEGTVSGGGAESFDQPVGGDGGDQGARIRPRRRRCSSGTAVGSRSRTRGTSSTGTPTGFWPMCRMLGDRSSARKRPRRRAICRWGSRRWWRGMFCRICWRGSGGPIPASMCRPSRTTATISSTLLIGGELDVAVMVISNLRDRNALQAEIFETSPYRLWLPLGHRLAAADSIELSDLSSEPLIMLTVDETEENTGKLLSALGAKPHVAFRTRSVEAVRSLVATGAGIALLPDLVYRPVVAGRRSHREPGYFGGAAGGAGGHGLAARLDPAAVGAGLYRDRAGAGGGTAAAVRPPPIVIPVQAGIQGGWHRCM